MRPRRRPRFGISITRIGMSVGVWLTGHAPDETTAARAFEAALPRFTSTPNCMFCRNACQTSLAEAEEIGHQVIGESE
jgi:hypothetical protein